MSEVSAFWSRWSPALLSVLRIVVAFLFMQHGAMKLFGFPGAGDHKVELMSLFGFAGVLEFFGAVIGLGLAILPCFGGDNDPSLVCVVPPEQVQTLDLWMVVHRDLAAVPRVRAVMEFLAGLGPRFSRQARRADADWS